MPPRRASAHTAQDSHSGRTLLGTHGPEEDADGGGRGEAVPPRDRGGEGRGKEETVSEERQLVVPKGRAFEKRPQGVVLGPGLRQPSRAAATARADDGLTDVGSARTYLSGCDNALGAERRVRAVKGEVVDAFGR